MADIASLGLEVKFDQVKQATAALRDMPAAASAAERAAQKWGAGTAAAARSADDFSKRVQGTIRSLEFERAQLARTATEQERFTALRRAGVAASSAEGVAITAAVRALQAQKAALGDNVTVVEKVRSGWSQLRGVLASVGAILVAQKLIETAKAAFEAAAGLDELAQQLGISARGLQALQLQAVQNGVNLEQLETGISKFSQKMGEAADGSKEMIESLDRLGVKILDANGSLRPTESLLRDVAKAITSIDDPAKRSAAAVDFFGKAGTRMLPLLGEIAKGIDGMAAASERSGTMISDETIAALDKVADRMERSKLEWRAFFANNAAEAVAFFDRMAVHWNDSANAINKWIKDTADSLTGWVHDLIESLLVGGARASAGFIETFAAMPSQLGALFIDAWNAAGEASVSGINKLTGAIVAASPDWLKKMLGITGGTDFKFTPAGGGGASGNVFGARIGAAADAAAADMQAQVQVARDAAAQKALIDRQAGMVANEAAARVGKLGGVGAPGVRNPAVKGAGDAAAKEAENQAKAYAKLVDQLDATAAAQDLMTKASAQGDVQFQAMTVHVDAQQKAIQIYGKALDDTDPKLRKIEELLTRIATGKAAEAFNVATTELQKQNVILEAQNRLMNAAPEIQAREIAAIKAKQDMEKTGLQESTEAYSKMFDARLQAIEQNETLKIQQEQLKKAQELWTEPLKRALGDIQQTAADAFEQILTSGNFSFQSLGEAFKKVIIRMAAEFLALATIRPVMSVLVNAVGGGGLANQLGFSTAGGAPGGGGGLGGMFGGGGSGISDFLGQTLFSSPTPSGGFADVGELLASGQAGAAGGLTVGGALGGVAGIGMGAFNLLSGKGGIGSMLGGGASILGGGLSLAGPLLGLGAAAGPIGMGIGLLGAILPMLLGGSTPEPPTNRAAGQLTWSGSGFNTGGGAWGPDANSKGLQDALQGVGGSIASLFTLMGGVKDASKVWGLNLESMAKGDFSNQTSFIVGPDGQRRQWGQGSNEQDVGLASGAGKIALESILGGAVGDITANMRKGLDQLNDQMSTTTVDAITQVVTEVKIFDDAIASFGKTVTDAGTALGNIDTTFQSLLDTGNKYGFDNSAIQAEKQKQRALVGSDFTDSVARLLDANDPNLLISDATRERKTLVENNRALLDAGVADYFDQIVNIEKIYSDKRLKIANDAAAAATAAAAASAAAISAAQKQANNALVSFVTSSVSTIQDLIRDLTPGGALSNLDPAGQLAGLRASSDASLAQAFADPTSMALIDRAVADARSFLEFDKSFTGGSTAFVGDQQTKLAQLQALQGATTQSAMGGAGDPGVKNLLQQLLNATNENFDSSAKRNSDIDMIFGLLVRYLANQDAA